MRSVYRNDAVAAEAISKLPVEDQSASETLTRMEAISKQWAELPNAPGTNKTFVAGETDKASFDALHAGLKEQHATLATCEQQFKARTAALNAQDEANAGFVGAAIAQGRAQFLPGTSERNVIDGIPTEPNPKSEPAPLPVAGQASAGPSAVSTSVNFDLPKAVNQ
jgi:hypothetical protein